MNAAFKGAYTLRLEFPHLGLWTKYSIGIRLRWKFIFPPANILGTDMNSVC